MEKEKKIFHSDKLKLEGEYLNGNSWNGKGYNLEGKEDFEIKDGKGKRKVFDEDDNLIYEE